MRILTKSKFKVENYDEKVQHNEVLEKINKEKSYNLGFHKKKKKFQIISIV